MDVLLANPRGFCAGVDRAIAIVERALEVFGAPIYVRHEVVHNKFVVNGLRDRGAVFVDELSDVPDDGIVIFSAHGVSKAVWAEAQSRGLRIFDATCPLVTKVHMEVARYSNEGREVILIGHAGHPEVEGTLGQYISAEGKGGIYLIETAGDVSGLEVKDSDNLAFVTQTTLSVDDTREIITALTGRFPAIVGPRKNDICYATQNRQDAVRGLADSCDLVLVVGSPNSSNSNRLREMAEKAGAKSYLIDNAGEIDAKWIKSAKHIGVTAGASAPEVLVREVTETLRRLGAENVRQAAGEEEDIVFVLPKELK